MKDWFDVTHDVMSLIDVPEVNNLLTGKIWALETPGGRTYLSDVVLGTLFGT